LGEVVDFEVDYVDVCMVFFGYVLFEFGEYVGGYGFELF